MTDDLTELVTIVDALASALERASVIEIKRDWYY